MNPHTATWTKSTNAPNLVIPQRWRKKAILETLVARFPPGNSLTLTLPPSLGLWEWGGGTRPVVFPDLLNGLFLEEVGNGKQWKFTGVHEDESSFGKTPIRQLPSAFFVVHLPPSQIFWPVESVQPQGPLLTSSFWTWICHSHSRPQTPHCQSGLFSFCPSEK